MVSNTVWRVFVGCILGTSACAPVSSDPTGALVTVTFNWNAWATSDQADSSYVSVEGPLFSTTVGEPPTPRVKSVNKRIDNEQYRGVVVYESKDHNSPVMEVLVHGEENRVLFRVKSKVALVIKATDHAEKHLTWIVSGGKKEGPLDLPPGEHQVEVVGTDDRLNASAR